MGDEYKYIGLTHSPTTHGKRNIRLRVNPNPKDFRKSYARPFCRTDKIKDFSKKKLRGWKISKRDRTRIRKIKRVKEKKRKVDRT